MEETQARAQLCEVGKLLYERGLVAASEGNLSLRLENGDILITPSGVCKGTMNPSMMVRCAPDGTPRSEDNSKRMPSSEIAMHVAIYQRRHDVGAVVHAHPPVATAFAACGIPLTEALLPEAVVSLGDVPVCSFALPSTKEVPESVMPYVHDHVAVLLANHGALTWGETLHEAFGRMETVEHVAAVHAQARLLGGGIELSAEDIALLEGMRTYYRDRAQVQKADMPPNGGRFGAAAESVSLRADKAAVRIVDQTLLPNEYTLVDLETREQLWDALTTLKVRGAPAIGVAAAYSFFVLAKQAAQKFPSREDFFEACTDNAAFIKSARPTAVNLSWAIQRMEGILANARLTSLPVADVVAHLEEECRAIHAETLAASNEISRLGASLLYEGDGVLTHCNAGPLACMGTGTGQGPLHYAHAHGKNLYAYVDETRPLLQGARITSFELDQAGIHTTLLCDNMAATVMKQGRIQAVMVGCDRIAANGDVANKIGTLGLAILAKYYDIPFYVLGPTSTIDLLCATGADIPIELRSEEEIRQLYFESPMAPASVACFNPSFDITDHSLVSAIVTEEGICYPPFSESLAALPFAQKHKPGL